MEDINNRKDRVVERTNTHSFNKSEGYRSRTITLLLLFVLGFLGIHNFYIHRKNVALVQLGMAALCGVGILVMVFSIMSGNVQADGSVDMSSAMGVLLGLSLAGGVIMTLGIWLIVDLILVILKDDASFGWPLKVR